MTAATLVQCIFSHLPRCDVPLRQVHGEDEFLFSPYSAYKVRRVQWEASPVADEYEVRRV